MDEAPRATETAFADGRTQPGRPSRGPILAAFLAFAFLNANNFLWLRADRLPLVWDQHAHYAGAMKFAYHVRNANRLNVPDETPGAAALRGFENDHPALAYAASAPVRGYLAFVQGLSLTPKHPPAVHAAGGAVAAVAGTDPDRVVFLANVLFSAMLLFAVFAIASRIAGGWAGAAAAWAAALFPSVFLELRALMLDVPLAAATALAAFAVLRADGFARRGASAAAGAALGFGCLVKETFPLYAACLVAGALWGAARAAPGGWREALGPARRANLAFAALAGLLVCGFWLIPSAPRMPAILLKHQAMGGVERDPAWWEFAGALFYPRAFASEQASFLWAATLVALLPLLARRRDRSWAPALAAWGIAPAVLFTFLSNKDARYTLPILPAAAVAIGIGFASFRSRVLGAAAAVLAVAAGIGQNVQMLWGAFGAVPPVPLIEAGSPPRRVSLFLFQPRPAFRGHPAPEPRGAPEILGWIEEEARRRKEAGGGVLEVRHLFDVPEATAPSEQAFLWRNFDARYGRGSVRVNIRSGFFEPEREIGRADLLLVKRKGDVGQAFRPQVLEATAYFDREARGRFRRIASCQGPDGHVIEAYRALAR